MKEVFSQLDNLLLQDALSLCFNRKKASELQEWLGGCYYDIIPTATLKSLFLVNHFYIGHFSLSCKISQQEAKGCMASGKSGHFLISANVRKSSVSHVFDFQEQPGSSTGTNPTHEIVSCSFSLIFDSWWCQQPSKKNDAEMNEIPSIRRRK